MAKVGYRPSPAFRRQLAHKAALCVADMSSQEVFNVGWAFATWRLRPGQLFEALAGEAARRAFSFTSQVLSSQQIFPASVVGCRVMAVLRGG